MGPMEAQKQASVDRTLTGKFSLSVRYLDIEYKSLSLKHMNSPCLIP